MLGLFEPERAKVGSLWKIRNESRFPISCPTMQVAYLNPEAFDPSFNEEIKYKIIFPSETLMYLDETKKIADRTFYKFLCSFSENNTAKVVWLDRRYCFSVVERFKEI